MTPLPRNNCDCCCNHQNLKKNVMIEEILETLGFKNKWDDEMGSREHPFGEYWDRDGNKKVCLKGDGIYAYTLSHAFEPYLELHLNFIPESKLLSEILKKTFYI